MEPVQITPEASSDIVKLAQGFNRTEVALGALKESKLTPKQAQQLEALLKKVGAASATTSQAVSEIQKINGYNAVVGQITVKGQQLDTLLTEGSFNKTREDQIAYAKRFGYRLATRAENRAYVRSLLAKEKDKSINAAEANALKTYRNRYVRDTKGGLGVDGRRVLDFDYGWRGDGAFPASGALFVRASAESK